MIRSRRSQIVLAFLAAVAAAVLTRGVAYAETAPGNAESDSASTVEVTGTDSSNVSVTTTTDSTTTVGSSSDGSGTTPEITKSTNTSVGNDVNSNDSTGPTEQTVQQNDQSMAPALADTTQLNREAVLGIGQSGQDGGEGSAKNHPAYSHGVNKSDTQTGLGENSPLPTVPASEKNAPVPISSSGSVNAFSSTGFGAGGKGLSAASFGLGAPSVRIQIIILALLMVVSASFISYMRRSGFSHAPRSDDLLAVISFVTNPRVEMQALPVWASPAFFVASDQQLTNYRKGGEWV